VSGASVHLVVADYDAGPSSLSGVSKSTQTTPRSYWRNAFKPSSVSCLVEVLQDVARGLIQLPLPVV
jgi:hypothetical protein